MFCDNNCDIWVRYCVKGPQSNACLVPTSLPLSWVASCLACYALVLWDDWPSPFLNTMLLYAMLIPLLLPTVLLKPISSILLSTCCSQFRSTDLFFRNPSLPFLPPHCGLGVPSRPCHITPCRKLHTPCNRPTTWMWVFWCLWITRLEAMTEEAICQHLEHNTYLLASAQCLLFSTVHDGAYIWTFSSSPGLSYHILLSLAHWKAVVLATIMNAFIR